LIGAGRAARVEQSGDDWSLVLAVRAGEPGAISRFIRRAADPIWTVCHHLAVDDAAAGNAFHQVLAALQIDNFASLAGYERPSQLNNFLVLFARDLLGRDALDRVARDTNRHWKAFEKAFCDDIGRLIRRRLRGAQGSATRDDVYQEICAGLAANGCHRLTAYDGHGSPFGFVLQVADRLLLDFLRRVHSRRRLPAAVARLEPLDQRLFRLIWWQRMTPQAAKMALATEELMSETQFASALSRLHQAVPADYQGGSREAALSEAVDVRDSGTPEVSLLEQEQDFALTGAVDALRALAADLPEAEKLYLRILLASADHLPAREMARLMQRPVAEVYRIRQQVLKRLKDGLADQTEIKNWLASV
jgi:RNA polymerase primary sigma factor